MNKRINQPANGWEEYQKLVMAELERHSRWLASLDAKLDELRVEMAALKVKSGVWGAAAGVLAVAVMIGVQLFLKS